MLYLYKISQTVVRGYDTYSDAVVAAENVEEAAKIHPASQRDTSNDIVSWDYWDPEHDLECWAPTPQHVVVTYLGVADLGWVKKGVICASFHAG